MENEDLDRILKEAEAEKPEEKKQEKKEEEKLDLYVVGADGT